MGMEIWMCSLLLISDDKVAWYANDGSGNFGAQQLISTNADGARICLMPKTWMGMEIWMYSLLLLVTLR